MHENICHEPHRKNSPHHVQASGKSARAGFAGLSVPFVSGMLSSSDLSSCTPPCFVRSPGLPPSSPPALLSSPPVASFFLASPFESPCRSWRRPPSRPRSRDASPRDRDRDR